MNSVKLTNGQNVAETPVEMWCLFSEAQTKLDISMFAMLTEKLAFVLPLRLVCTSVSQMSMKPSRDS